MFVEKFHFLIYSHSTHADSFIEEFTLKIAKNLLEATYRQNRVNKRFTTPPKTPNNSNNPRPTGEGRLFGGRPTNAIPEGAAWNLGGGVLCDGRVYMKGILYDMYCMGVCVGGIRL